MDPNPSLSLAKLRENYMRASLDTRAGLDETTVDRNPITQFRRWFEEAQTSGLKEPNAMTLATCTSDGRPSARIVLLKELSDAGFVFFTNYESRKGEELAGNPHAALVFYWAELERQVRVEGVAAAVPRSQSEQYFAQRPKGSRLGALVSPQSRVIESRTILESALKDLEARYEGTDHVPAPENWGGYVVNPHRIEFWQGRPNRLHDRICFVKEQGSEWRVIRLAP